MRICYHDIHDHDFERLVVAICCEYLGDGVQSFSTGPDGGRDARFEGTAAKFPSEANGLVGRFVIQAKHTEHPFAKFSDSDFASDAESSIISQELPRVARLVAERELDHYFLFSNRRLAGAADADIRTRIKKEAGATTVELFGVERIDQALRRYPSIEKVANIRPLSGPLVVTPDDLAEIIGALDRDKDAFATGAQPVDQSVDKLQRTSFEKKNKVNGLSEDFAKEIRTEYLKDFAAIKTFLAAPSNRAVLERYSDAAREFHEQILAHRNDHDSFDKALVRIQTLLFQRDSDLARKKRLTKLVLYYMYWNCDVGKTEA